MRCAYCHQEIRHEQTYFKLVTSDHTRFHHVCYMYLKPRELMKLTGLMMPHVVMCNDSEGWEHS